jgi:hypothetical protein
MPPQQSEGLLDFFFQRERFGAHEAIGSIFLRLWAAAVICRLDLKTDHGNVKPAARVQTLRHFVRACPAKGLAASALARAANLPEFGGVADPPEGARANKH